MIPYSLHKAIIINPKPDKDTKVGKTSNNIPNAAKVDAQILSEILGNRTQQCIHRITCLKQVGFIREQVHYLQINEFFILTHQ